MLLDQMEEDATNTRDKIDIHVLSGKPSNIQNIERLPTYERSPRRQASLSASAQDFRAMEEFERDSILKALDTTPHSPRDVLEESLRYSDYSDSNSSSKESTSSSEAQCMNNNASLWRGFLRLWRNRSMKRLPTFPPRVSRISRWISIRDHHDMRCSGNDGDDGNDFCLFKPSWKIFTSLELQNATKNFRHDNIIGTGGFAEVYEGKLENGQLIAVKKLIKGTVDEKTHLFLSELGILVHINHEHIAKLIGVSVDGGFNLVFSLSPHGSLSTLLHGHGSLSSLLSGTYRGKLEWEIRYKIAIGTAHGLEYLHERCQRRIIHRDIKSANILITENFEPQICDFGLALWLPDQLTHHIVSSFEGTFGYLPPEYLTHGVVNEKTDIFALGVLLLELVSGRKAIDSLQQSLLMWARPLIEKNAIEELVDPSMNHIYDSKQLKRLIQVASLCTQHSAVLRPRISEVLTLLRGEEAKLDDRVIHKQPVKRRTYSEELHDAEEYNVTRYLNDISRHRQIALDFL